MDPSDALIHKAYVRCAIKLAPCARISGETLEASLDVQNNKINAEGIETARDTDGR